MNFQERYEQRKKNTEGQLSSFLQKNFPEFKQNFLEELFVWSCLPGIKKICGDMDLHMAVSFSKEEEKGSWNGYLIDGNGNLEVKDFFSDIREESMAIIRAKFPIQGIEAEMSQSWGLLNTGLDFSDMYPGPVDVVWCVTFMPVKTVMVHKIVANVILDILEKNVKNLNEILIDNKKNIHQYFEKTVFMDYYIIELEKCFEEISDVKMITAVSLENYEKRESNGTIYFMRDISNCEMICFDRNSYQERGFWHQKNIQNIRKLLEICRDSKMGLVVSDQGSGDREKGLAIISNTQIQSY